MKIIKSLQLDRDDHQDMADLKDVIEFTNMAASFFYDDPINGPRDADTGEGTRAINSLKGGHPFELKHIQRAIDEVDNALVRLGARAANPLFPEDTKGQYVENLAAVKRILHKWKDALDEG